MCDECECEYEYEYEYDLMKKQEYVAEADGADAVIVGCGEEVKEGEKRDERREAVV